MEDQMYQAAAVSVMDVRTGFVVYENAQHELMYPASITKIMTAMLVLEEVNDLQEQMIFSENAVYSLPHYAGRINALAGDTLTVYEALYTLMLPSGNDSANALAEHVAGTIPSFVARMNDRAAEIGAINTNFINPCGLPGDGQHTTAYDMALIMREAIQNPVFVRIISTPEFFIPPTLENFPDGWPFLNTNLLIQEGEFYNPWVIGGKTGFTNAAQHTLVSYARRGEQEFIVSVLYAPRRATFSDTTALLDHVFEMPVRRLFDSASQYWELPVIQNIDGELETISSITARGRENLSLTTPEGLAQIRYEIVIPEHLVPPVRAGDVIGRKSFFAGDDFITSIDILSDSTVLPRIVTPLVEPPAPSVFERTEVSAIGGSFAFWYIPAAFAVIFILLMIRRQIKIIRRRRRRIARVRYTRYHNYN